MFLSRIEVNGFKSFCNKKEIIINKGITGVVGPNGSGKSNIADALRWVLGEQSSKNLRGQTMQDVIFNGTVERNKKNCCEVALIFDNSKKALEPEYNEISVRRRMYRSGECIYYINNTACRLKDIIDLFRDTGIGKEGYSIIGQGKIDEILTSKPTARRKVFEEAAGIMKYRIRKEEAEKNLEKTKDNIVRLTDIISELEIQIAPLEKQMQEAKNYLTLREKLKTWEINLFLYNYEKSDERIAKNQELILENEDEISNIDTKIAGVNVQISKAKQELGEIQNIIEVHNAEFNRFSNEQERLKGDINVIEEKERNYAVNLEKNKALEQTAKDAIEENNKLIATYKAKINEINEVTDTQYEVIEDLKEEIASLTEKYGNFSANIESIRQEIEDKRTLMQSLNIELSEKQVKAELLTKKHEEIKTQIGEYEEHIKSQREEIATLEAQKEKISDESTQIRRTLNNFVGEINNLSSQKKEIEDKHTNMLHKLNEAKSKHNLLSNMEYEGYFDSVKELFKSAKQAPHIAKKITGVLAELIEVPKEYETPIEVILGNALQNVVVEEDEDAKDIIEHLRKFNLGRVTFLPVNALKIKYLQKEERKYLQEEGVLCLASEAISCKQNVRGAIDFLLARTVIVKDMQCAIKLMRKANYAFRAVTMEGDFIKPGGVITGGSIKNQKAGLLSKKRIIAELEERAVALTAKMETCKTELKGKQEEIDAKVECQQEYLDKLRELEIKSASLKERILGANNSLSERDEVLYDLQTRELDSYNSLVQLNKHISALEGEITDITEEYEERVVAGSKTEEEYKAGATKLNDLKDKLNLHEKEHQEHSGNKNIVARDLEYVKGENARLQGEIEASQKQSEELQKEVLEISYKKEEIIRRLSEIFEYIKNAGGNAKEIFVKRDNLNIYIEEYEEKVGKIHEEKNILIETKYKLMANKEKIELSKETLLNKLWDDYGLTYTNALPFKVDFSYNSGVKEAEDIKNQIKAMGSINPNAIEDYARVKERYDNLLVQKADLQNAILDLEVVIKDLLNNMTDSFKEKFAQINSNFNRVYKELFGGGDAKIVLLEDDNIMECGIDIIAEPPGKKLQSITLLSGGEKAFTAIALLFAMLEINPSPICLLDEIDAPLDDANVIRFSEYVKMLSKDLQFIIITHRKPTMAICDTLYGIAMQERGVSNIVSVSLN